MEPYDLWQPYKGRDWIPVVGLIMREKRTGDEYCLNGGLKQGSRGIETLYSVYQNLCVVTLSAGIGIGAAWCIITNIPK